MSINVDKYTTEAEAAVAAQAVNAAVNTEILSATKTLTDSDLPNQLLDPNDTTKIVKLPLPTASSPTFNIFNDAFSREGVDWDSNILTVQDANGFELAASIATDERITFTPVPGTGWTVGAIESGLIRDNGTPGTSANIHDHDFSGILGGVLNLWLSPRDAPNTLSSAGGDHWALVTHGGWSGTLTGYYGNEFTGDGGQTGFFADHPSSTTTLVYQVAGTIVNGTVLTDASGPRGTATVSSISAFDNIAYEFNHVVPFAGTIDTLILGVTGSSPDSVTLEIYKNGSLAETKIITGLTGGDVDGEEEVSLSGFSVVAGDQLNVKYTARGGGTTWSQANVRLRQTNSGSTGGLLMDFSGRDNALGYLVDQDTLAFNDLRGNFICGFAFTTGSFAYRNARPEAAPFPTVTLYKNGVSSETHVTTGRLAGASSAFSTSFAVGDRIGVTFGLINAFNLVRINTDEIPERILPGDGPLANSLVSKMVVTHTSTPISGNVTRDGSPAEAIPSTALTAVAGGPPTHFGVLTLRNTPIPTGDVIAQTTGATLVYTMAPRA